MDLGYITAKSCIRLDLVGRFERIGYSLVEVVREVIRPEGFSTGFHYLSEFVDWAWFEYLFCGV